MAVHQRNPVRVYEEENLTRASFKTGNVSKGNAGRQVLRNVSNVPSRRLPVAIKKEGKGLKDISENVEKPVKQKECVKTEQELPLKLESFTVESKVKEVKDIDEDDSENLTLCAEYVKDIYKYLTKNEKKLVPSDYLKRHNEITEKMRTILIDWLIQVHQKFNLLQETLYLTVYTIDRYLDKEQVKRSDLQLVGVTAMLLASKYEEMYAPEVADFVYITDNAYSKDKIKIMEQKMMKTLGYNFSNPLCLQFLRRNSKAGEVNAIKHTLAKFLMELSLISYKLSRKYPSEIAAAALYLSIKLVDSSVWTPTLEHYSGYSEDEILPIVGELASLAMSMEASKFEAVKIKYAASKLLKVSRMPELKGQTIRHYASYSSTNH